MWKTRLYLALLLVAVGPLASATAQVREAKVAGQFYPDDPVELHELVQELLTRQPEPAFSGKPRVLIVPHAGYQYSGLVAAHGFRHLQGHRYDGVVVVGFTHRMPFAGASVDTAEAYRTPLGEIPVDQEGAAILLAHQGVRHVEEAHTSGEHSLEVELPFLQEVLGHFKLVPVLMGSADWKDAEQLAEALATLARVGDYLFVFSSDLSHYRPYSQAQRIDEAAVSAMVLETSQALHRLFAAGEIEACGRGPIVTSALLAAKLGHLKREPLYYANSGDTYGNPKSVVGYAAVAMYEQPAPVSGRLSPEAGMALVRSARASLEYGLRRRDGPDPSEELKRYPELSQASGVFVTLRKRGVLRGCIGRIETTEALSTLVPRVALDSALRDSRFQPVSVEELDELQVEVSVLTPPARLPAHEDLVPGRDGVILEHQGRRGVFLPQVWDETGWTRLEFLRELASQKAGLPPDAWEQAALYVFQDQIFEEPHLNN